MIHLFLWLLAVVDHFLSTIPHVGFLFCAHLPMCNVHVTMRYLFGFRKLFLLFLLLFTCSVVSCWRCRCRRLTDRHTNMKLWASHVRITETTAHTTLMPDTFWHKFTQTRANTWHTHVSDRPSKAGDRSSTHKSRSKRFAKNMKLRWTNLKFAVESMKTTPLKWMKCCVQHEYWSFSLLHSFR